MATMLSTGVSIVFGVVEPKPLKDFPEGRTRIKIRSRAVVVVYARTQTGIRAFAVHDNGAEWVPAFEFARNERPKS
jgi:hypothetical protein